MGRFSLLRAAEPTGVFTPNLRGEKKTWVFDVLWVEEVLLLRLMRR